MSVSVTELGLDRLPVADRIELIEQLWDTLPRGVGPDVVPAWHLQLLEERLAEADANPGAGRPWREVLDEIEKRS